MPAQFMRHICVDISGYEDESDPPLRPGIFYIYRMTGSLTTSEIGCVQSFSRAKVAAGQGGGKILFVLV